MLETNTSLKELTLSKNDVGDEGAKSIAEVLQNNTSLTSLDLSKIYWIFRL